MKENDGCALQQYNDGDWVPMAIRRTSFPMQVLKELESGLTVEYNNMMLRRADWAERQAIFIALRFGNKDGA